MDSYLPARFSLSPFFVRHVAKPKRMKHIEGLHGAPICAVNDEGYMPTKGGYENSAAAFPPNNYMEHLIKSSDSFKQMPSFRKKEKALGPSGQFQTYGLIEDTQRWKAELDKLASSIGLITQNDIENENRKKFIKENYSNNSKVPKTPTLRSNSPDKKPVSRGTSRLNEPLKTGQKLSRGGTPAQTAMSLVNKPNYLVDDRDRELWMLQVLCQVLNTDNLYDVQSWLVSSDPTAKEQVKQLLDNAMKGLEESGRIQPAMPIVDVKNQTPALEKIVKKMDEDKSYNIELDTLKDTIDRIKEAQTKKDQHRHASPLRAVTSVRPSGADSVNILKLEEDAERYPIITPNLQREMDRSTKIQSNERPETPRQMFTRNNNNSNNNNNNNRNDNDSPISPVFNINIFPKSAAQSKPKQKPKTKNIGNDNNKSINANGGAVIKVEAPVKDMKIEEVNVTMFVKDEKSNTVQSIQGNWKPVNSIVKK